jgi:L-ectoine synthase
VRDVAVAVIFSAADDGRGGAFPLAPALRPCFCAAKMRAMDADSRSGQELAGARAAFGRSDWKAARAAFERARRRAGRRGARRSRASTVVAWRRGQLDRDEGEGLRRIPEGGLLGVGGTLSDGRSLAYTDLGSTSSPLVYFDGKRSFISRKVNRSMFVRNVKDILGTERDVNGKGWKSRRLILARDGLTYSVHETILEAKNTLRFTYSAHRETVYCIEGKGSVQNVLTGETWPIHPGSIYSVGVGDDHVVKTQSEMKLICIFDPPLEGQEEAD